MSRMGQNERLAAEATAALAEAIREAQGRRDISIAELSRRSEIPYSSLRKIRSGNQAIGWEELVKIARALSVSASSLAARAEELDSSV